MFTKQIKAQDVTVGDQMVNLGRVEEIENFIPNMVTLITKDEHHNAGRIYLPLDAPVILSLPETCEFDFAHTRIWCGNPNCREA